MATALPAAHAYGADNASRYHNLRELGKKLAGMVACDCAFSYSELAVFCCACPGIRVAIDCELARNTNPAALREFFIRAGADAKTKFWSNSRAARAWTALEAIAKFTGLGLAGEIIRAAAPHIGHRSGEIEYRGESIAWLSIAFTGHWLSVAYESGHKPDFQISFIHSCKNLRSLMPCSIST